MKVKQGINLLITRAEVEEVAFKKTYSNKDYVQVHLELYAGEKRVTSMFLSSNEDKENPNYVEFDLEMEDILRRLYEKIQLNANISLRRLSKQIGG